MKCAYSENNRGREKLPAASRLHIGEMISWAVGKNARGDGASRLRDSIDKIDDY